MQNKIINFPKTENQKSFNAPSFSKTMLIRETIHIALVRDWNRLKANFVTGVIDIQADNSNPSETMLPEMDIMLLEKGFYNSLGDVNSQPKQNNNLKYPQKNISLLKD